MNGKLTKAIALLTLVAVLVLAGCGSQPAKEEAKGQPQPQPAQKFVNIATGGTAGTYYPLGGAMAEILNKNVKGINATAQSTGASVANLNLLNEGKVEMALVQNDIAFYAAQGAEMFKDKKIDGLAGIATLYPETIQIVTLASKNIKSVADLKGKKVAVGAAGSGTEANARQILEAYGLSYKDLTAQYLNFADAASNLKDGNVDAAFVTAGFPTAAIQDVAAQHKIALIPIADDKIAALAKKYPFYTKVVVPGKTYTSLDQDTVTVAVMAMLITKKSLDQNLVYDMTKAIFTHLDRLAAAHAAGKLIQVKTATNGMPVELHPGAKKFFDETK
ncbi:MAG: TAXI family TRAP transporter solute-binding subunit [Firmicutes bacterium]|nr:TAXI family TRAP transporter solute-binding subunit [Bacillota bacterium]MCL5040266.1 TAXI family TRAP transporter solute-binding subunit [Bacillota bacterium]